MGVRNSFHRFRRTVRHFGSRYGASDATADCDPYRNFFTTRPPYIRMVSGLGNLLLLEDWMLGRFVESSPPLHPEPPPAPLAPIAICRRGRRSGRLDFPNQPPTWETLTGARTLMLFIISCRDQGHEQWERLSLHSKPYCWTRTLKL